MTLAGAALTASGWYAFLRKEGSHARRQTSQPEPEKQSEPCGDWDADADSLESRVRTAMEKDPLDFGLQGKHWTAHLLLHFLKQEFSMEASEKAIRQALKELGYAWNGSQYRLARAQAPQGKGA